MIKSHYSYRPHLKHLSILIIIFILVSCEFEKTIPKPSPNRVVNRNTGEFAVDRLFFNPNLHIESSTGFDFTDSTISHISQEQATLTTSALQFNTPFHTIHSVYEVTDLIVPIGGIQDHLEKLEIYFRLGTSENEWTDWHSLSDLRGNDDIEMRFLLRYNPSRASMFNNALFDYAQIKLISNSENYGKMIAKGLRFGVMNYGNSNRSKKNVKTMIQQGTLALQCFTPMSEGYLEWCDPPEKDMAIYSKPYWYNIINKGNKLINLFEERDCSDISFPPILTLECDI